MDMRRYDRQHILPHVGKEGQRRLFRANVVIVGCGALGCASAMLLARAGVGSLKVVDRDVVELDNLHRQVLFMEKDIGRPKAEAAAERLRKANSEIKVEGLVDDVNFSNVLKLIEGADAVMDGTDNMDTRYLLNDACVKTGIPLIYGGAIATYGMTMTIVPGKTACFRCVYPKPPAPGTLPTCDTAGILNAVPVAVASMQAAQALRLIVSSEFEKSITALDLWLGEFSKIKVEKRKDCPCCGKGKYEYLGARRSELIASLCGRGAFSINPLRKGELNLKALGTKLKKLGTVRLGNGVLFLNVGNSEMTIFRDGRAMIKGAGDEKRARALYSKYVGD